MKQRITTTIFLLTVFYGLTNESVFGQPNKISKEEKIYGLSKFWQEVNYNFVYLSKVDRKEWNDLYMKYSREVQETKNDYEYYRLLQKFCAFLKDGHTNIWFPKEIQDNVFISDFGDYKIVIENFEGKAIITNVNSSKRKEIPIGTEITKVNGITAKEYIDKNVRPYISTSTKHVLEDLSITNMLEGYVGTTFDLELKTSNGEIRTIKLVHNKAKEKDLYPVADKEKLFEFTWLTDDIAYVAFNSFSDWDIMDLFDKKLPEIHKAKRLIIDLRRNSGGDENIARELFKYLTNDTILYGSKSQSRLHIPTYKAWGAWTKVTDTLKNVWQKQAYLTYNDQYYYNFPYESYSTANLGISRIEIPTAILIGHGTASAAEDFLIYASNQENIIRIGEPTYGSTGQPFIFELPNGGVGRVCTKKDTYPNGKEFVGHGIQPDIEIKKTLSDYLENKDLILEKAIDYLKEK